MKYVHRIYTAKHSYAMQWCTESWMCTITQNSNMKCVEENDLFGQPLKLNQVCQNFYFLGGHMTYQVSWACSPEHLHQTLILCFDGSEDQSVLL
jgi:hypothetical protein